MAVYAETQIYCRSCQRHVLARKRATNHVLHLLASVLLCGLWIPVWIVIALLASSEPWRCSVCGGAERPMAPVRPALQPLPGAVQQMPAVQHRPKYKPILQSLKWWHWAIAAGWIGLSVLVLSRRNLTSLWSSNASGSYEETAVSTLPLELGEGDKPIAVTVYPVDGTPSRLSLPVGTRVEQLQRMGAPPDFLVAPRRVRIISGPSAGTVVWVSGTQVQAARQR